MASKGRKISTVAVIILIVCILCTILLLTTLNQNVYGESNRASGGNSAFDAGDVPDTVYPQDAHTYTVGVPTEGAADYATVADALADEAVSGNVVLKLVSIVTESVAISIPGRVDSLVIDSVDTTKYRLRLTGYGESWSNNGGWSTQNACAVFCNGKSFTLGKYVELVATTFNNSVAIFGGGYKQDVTGNPVITFDGNYYYNRNNAQIFAGGFNSDLTGDVAIVVNGDLTNGDVYCGGLADVRLSSAESTDQSQAPRSASATVTGNVTVTVSGSGVVNSVYGGGSARVTSSSNESGAEAALAWRVVSTLQGSATISLPEGASCTFVYCGGYANSSRIDSDAESYVSGNVTLSASGANMKYLRCGGDSTVFGNDSTNTNAHARAVNEGTVDATVTGCTFSGSGNGQNIIAGGYAYMYSVADGNQSVTESRGKITLAITDTQIYGEVIGGGYANNSNPTDAGKADTFVKAMVGDAEVRLTNVTQANNFYSKIYGAGAAFGDYACFEKTGDLLFVVDGYRLNNTANDNRNALIIGAGGSVSGIDFTQASTVRGNITMSLKNIGTNVADGYIDLLTAGAHCGADSSFYMIGDVLLTLEQCELPIDEFAAIYMFNNATGIDYDSLTIEGSVTARINGVTVANNYGSAYIQSAGATAAADKIETYFDTCTFSDKTYDGWINKASASVTVKNQKSSYNGCAFEGPYFGNTVSDADDIYNVTERNEQIFNACTLKETHVFTAGGTSSFVKAGVAASSYTDCASIGAYFGNAASGAGSAIELSEASITFANCPSIGDVRTATASGVGAKVAVTGRLNAEYLNCTTERLYGLITTGQNSVCEVAEAVSFLRGTTVNKYYSGAEVSGSNARLDVGRISSTLNASTTKSYFFGGVYMTQKTASVNVKDIEMTLEDNVDVVSSFNWAGSYVAGGGAMSNDSVSLTVDNCASIKNVYLANWAADTSNTVIKKALLSIINSNMSGSKLRAGGYSNTKIEQATIDVKDSSFEGGSEIHAGGYQTTEINSVDISFKNTSLINSAIYAGGEGGATTIGNATISFENGSLTNSGIYASNKGGAAVIDSVILNLSNATLRSSNVVAGPYAAGGTGSVKNAVTLNLHNLDDDGMIYMSSVDEGTSGTCDVAVNATGNVTVGGLVIYDGIFKSVSLNVGDGTIPTVLSAPYIFAVDYIDAVNIFDGAKLRYESNDFILLYDVRSLSLNKGGVLEIEKDESVVDFIGGGTLNMASGARFDVTGSASGETTVNITDGVKDTQYISVTAPGAELAFVSERDAQTNLMLRKTQNAEDNSVAWIYALTRRVDFVTGDGTLNPQYIDDGAVVTAPQMQVKNGYESRWYADAAHTTLWDFEDTVTSDITLYHSYYLIVNVTASGDVKTAYDGTERTLSVNVASDADITISYAWYKNGVKTSTGASLKVVSVADNGNYVCVVSCEGSDGSATKEAAFVVEISKAVPVVDSPSDLSAQYGDTLASVTLASGWAWKNGDSKVGEPGTRSFEAVYTPIDTDNYTTLERTLSVRVELATETITINGQLDKAYDGITVGTPAFAQIGDGTANVFWYAQKGDSWEALEGAPVDAGSYKVVIYTDATAHFAAASGEKTFTIAKAVIDTTGLGFDNVTVVYDGQPHSILLSGELPDGISEVVYSNNGKTDAGVYEVSASFVVDENNYVHINDMTAVLTVNQKEIVGKTDDGEVIVSGNNGLNPGYSVDFKVVADATHKNYDLSSFGKNARVEAAFDIRLLDDSLNEVQPDGTVVVRLKIPAGLVGKDFVLVHVHGDTATAVEYRTEGGFVVFETDSFSDFVFVSETETPWWIIAVGVGAGVVVIAGILLAVFIVRRKKAKA